MLNAQPPSYNTSSTNRQSVSGLGVPGAQGIPVQGGSRLWSANPVVPVGGVSGGLSPGGVGTSSYSQPSSIPTVSSLPGPAPDGAGSIPASINAPKQTGNVASMLQALLGGRQMP